MVKKTVKKKAVKKAEDKVDMVNHPPHYKKHPSGKEAIELIENMKTPTLASAMKYWLRRDHKENPVQDLEKMLWYVEREIGRRLSPKKPAEVRKTAEDFIKAEKSKLIEKVLEADKKPKDVEALKAVIPTIKRAIRAAKKKAK